MSYEILPGGPPPWLIPFCVSCELPVERFTIYPPTIPGVVCFECECHGKTEGGMVTEGEIEAAAKDPTKKIKAFRRRKGFDSVW